MKIYQCSEGKHDNFCTKVQSEDDSKDGYLGISFCSYPDTKHFIAYTTFVVYGLPQ